MTLQFSLYIDTYFLKYNSNEEIKLQNLERKLRTKRDKIGYTFPLINSNETVQCWYKLVHTTRKITPIT